jgi:hypothetical protein
MEVSMRATTAVSLLVLAGFVGAARGVGNFYPVSQFPMYSGSAGDAAARVMLFADGEYFEVDAFTDFACESWVPLDVGRCEGASSIPYIDRETEAWLLAHRGAPAATGRHFELVRRVFSFDGAQRPAHCVLTRCTAVPR